MRRRHATAFRANHRVKGEAHPVNEELQQGSAIDLARVLNDQSGPFETADRVVRRSEADPDGIRE